MKILTYIFALLILTPQLYASGGILFSAGGVESASPSCSIFDADFEGESDATQLYNITDAWTNDGASAGNFEIDTAYSSTGSASAKIDTGDNSGNRVYKTYSEQTGTFALTFAVRWVAGSAGTRDLEFLAISDGDFSWNNTLVLPLQISEVDGSLNYHNGTAWTDTTYNITSETWVTLEFAMDMSTDTFDLVVNSTTYVTDGAFQSSGLSPDRVYFRRFSSGSNGGNVWVDDLCIN
jgi:hypothetical protein